MTLPLQMPYPPMEALLVDEIPAEGQGQYEPKWDGFRCLAFRDGQQVELQSKNGQPLARYFPELVGLLRTIRAERFVLDSEIVIPINGKLSFDDLLQRIHPAESRIKKLATECPATLLVFDLLVDAEGRSLVDKTLRERRQHLESLATPLTVCLVVFAKHVPQLEFVGVLLSDEPVMETKISYYQRLLAMDQDEAVDLVEDYLKRRPREQVYDEVLLSALSYAKEDRLRGNLTEGEARFIFDATREILQDLAASDLEVPAAGNGSVTASAEDSFSKFSIVGCPAHGDADEIGLLMLLRQLLDSKRYEVDIISSKALTSE